MVQPAGNDGRYLLSESFKDWYRAMLPDFKFSSNYQHPHFQLCPYPDIADYRGRQRGVLCVPRDRPALDNYQQMLASIGHDPGVVALIQNLELTRYLERMPIMTSSDVLLGGDKVCRLMTLDAVNWWCVVELSDPGLYLQSLRAIESITTSFTNNPHVAINIQPVKRWFIVPDAGKYYFITPFYGQTLAQKWPTLSGKEQKKILRAMRDLLPRFEEKGLYWRDFAPRNMLFSDTDGIVLIDFEHLLDTSEITTHERIVLDRYRRIWFGDMLTTQEIDYLFGELPVFNVDDESLFYDADDLEKEYFGRSKIRFSQRLSLLDMIGEVERVHRYSKADIFGHRIGLYLSDFLEVRSEAVLYKILQRLDKGAWIDLLYGLQQCIDFDQQNCIMSIYNKGVETSMAGEFLNDMQLRTLRKQTIDQEVTQWILEKTHTHGAADS